MPDGVETVRASDREPFAAPSGLGFLEAHPSLFDALDEEARRALADESATYRARRQQVVFCTGEKVAHLYVVLGGSLKLVRHSEEGKELIVSLVREGDAFGSPFRSVDSPTLAQALEESSLLLVPHAALRRALTSCPELALALITHLEQRQQQVELALARIAFESVPRRLARALLDSSDASSGALRFPLNQTEIASLIGSSRETVCSILNQFRRTGWLDIERGQIRVADRDGLATVR